MRARGEGLRPRVTRFAALPVLSIAAAMIALPVVARHSTPTEWAALAIGQAVGSSAALIVGWGWTLTGPSLIARADDLARRRMYADSLLVRVPLFLLIAPAAVALSIVLSPPNTTLLAAGMGLASTLTGLSIGWYCVGLARPLDVAAFELLPRIAAGATAAILINYGAELVIYPILLSASTFCALLLHATKTLRHSQVRISFQPNAIIRLLRDGLPGVISESASGVYAYAGAALISIQSLPREVATFSSAERIYRVALSAIVVLNNASQGWVAEARVQSALSRTRMALAAQAVVGCTGMLGLTLFGPWLSSVLFGYDLAIGRSIAFYFGITFFIVSLNTGLGRYVLVPNGYTKRVMASTLVGAGLGIPAILLAAKYGGASGGAAGVAVSQGAVLLVLLPRSVSLLRRMASSTPSRSSQEPL
jgi:O-antigen/teichoic acid export membrane protein